MAGCDAVFHAAAAVSLDPRRARETYDTNVGATKAVLGAGSAIGIGNLLYVSSVMALFHPGAAGVDESTALSELSEPYSRSKRDSEAHVRELQQQGVPVQITYPAGVVGPDDPKLSAANRAIRVVHRADAAREARRASNASTCATSPWRMFGCWSIHQLATSMTTRFIIGGHFYPWDELRHRLEALLGRRIFSPRVPPRLMRFMGATAGSSQGAGAVLRLRSPPSP